jgi:putative ABC transport system permease protein
MRIRFVEGDYLKIFPLPMLSPGNPLTELPPSMVLIMESAAMQRFGTTDVVGRSLIIAQRLEVTIGGVVQTMTRPSHVDSVLGGTDLIVPMRVMDELSLWTAGGEPPDNWHDQSYRIYVRFSSAHPLEIARYNERLRRFSESNVPVRYYLSGPHNPIFSFRPIEENAPSHLKLALGDVSVTKLLVFAGFLVLFVASLNYSNLVIAQLTQRSQAGRYRRTMRATAFRCPRSFLRRGVLTRSSSMKQPRRGSVGPGRSRP